MRPSPALYRRRLRFTTKQVQGGFYRGTQTGSIGAHRSNGGYLIDYRKVRHFVVPDLTGFNLTPFVSKEVERRRRDTDLTRKENSRRIDGMAFLRTWKNQNPDEYEKVVEFQQSMGLEQEQSEEGDRSHEQQQQQVQQAEAKVKEDQEVFMAEDVVADAKPTQSQQQAKP